MTTILIVLFIVGYLFIALEHNTGINKAAPALLTGVICWTVYIMMTDKQPHFVIHELHEAIGEVAGILFFLMGAMTIVELIDAHEGFAVITNQITTKNQTRLLWIVSFITFFLSSVLDNLTTTIVMISILRKLVKSHKKRLFFASMVVIAANAGGAWSPIGDVTTTMLWIEERISTAGIIKSLFIPSIVCTLVPLIFASMTMPGGILNRKNKMELDAVDPQLAGSSVQFKHVKVPVTNFERTLVFGLGIGALLFVPIFKTITHLPPFMGIYLGLGILWAVTELMHKKKNDEDKDPLSVIGVLRKIDVPSVLFFFGILVSISSLQATGVLKDAALALDKLFGDIHLIAITLGLLSSIVDNVPLVAATIGMYDVVQYPLDHPMWEMLAYCTGTGGSVLIIGSASGVAAMGMEKIEFGWYAKNIAWLALLGYFAGAFVYMLAGG